MTTIVLADDHALVREGLCTILRGEDDWSVVGEANDGLQALALAEQLQPNVLIVDLMLPRLNGLEVIRQIRRRNPRTLLVALSMHANESYVLAALRNGAAAYVLKVVQV
jgi:two-component system, NarL family, response regulator NreC